MVEALGHSTRVFTSLIQGIQTLAKENEDSMQNVQKLEERMKQVEHIVSVVSAIASQTNLLALNASIEADSQESMEEALRLLRKKYVNLLMKVIVLQETYRSYYGICKMKYNKLQ